jgi:glycosyltransferase involved in cell wall biosynthesis
MKIVQVSVGTVRMPPKEGNAPLQVIFNTSKHLAKMGHQVIILDRKYSKDDLDIELLDGVEVARMSVLQIPFKRAPGFMRFILAELNAILFAIAASFYLRKNGPNVHIIHLHLTSIGLIVTTLNRRLRGKIFYTCHLSQWALANSGLSFWVRSHLFLDAYIMKRVEKVIALNDSAKKSFIYLGKVKEDSIIVLPNGVDEDFFHPDIVVTDVTQKYGLEGKMIVLFVGRLARTKGLEYLLEAADIIVNKYNYKNALFILVGPYTFAGVDRPLGKDEIANYVQLHKLEENILLTGSLPLEEVRKLYVACDIFVLPSLAEGDPLVTIEAMSSGKPVIGTKVGGIPRHIRDRWNGFLIDPADERQLAERIKYLIDNPEERKMMGANSRKYVEEEFDWGIIADRLFQIYQSNFLRSQSK